MFDKNIKIIDYIKRIYLIFNLNIIFSTCFPVNEMSCFSIFCQPTTLKSEHSSKIS